MQAAVSKDGPKANTALVWFKWTHGAALYSNTEDSPYSRVWSSDFFSLQVRQPRGKDKYKSDKMWTSILRKQGHY